MSSQSTNHRPHERKRGAQERSTSSRQPHAEPVHAEAVAARPQGLTSKKLVVVLTLMLAAYLGAYNYASAQSASALGASADAGLFGAPAAGGGCGMSADGSGGGGCCGGGGPEVEGSTAVEGDVQSIDVDTSQGSFNPNVIKAKAGVPIEITFSQAPGGCLSGVYFPDFDINEDLTGGAKTVQLPALEPGEYSFFCQMQMVSARIVVE